MNESYETKRDRKNQDHQATRFSYSCAQSTEREHKEKIPKTEGSRATRRMERFPCNGWLHLTITQHSSNVLIDFKHATSHTAYIDTSLPEKWKTYIQEHGKSETPGQVWLFTPSKFK